MDSSSLLHVVTESQFNREGRGLGKVHQPRGCLLRHNDHVMGGWDQFLSGTDESWRFFRNIFLIAWFTNIYLVNITFIETSDHVEISDLSVLLLL